MTSARELSLSRFAGFLTLLLLAMMLPVGEARAHAALNAAEPRDGALVEVPPDRYSLTFSEPVSPLSLRLVMPDGTAIPLDRFAVKDRTVEIEAPDGLARGTHVLSWRVVSEDGHPVGGSIVFSIGEESAEAPVIEEEIDWTVRGWLWLGKVALYAGLFIGIGGVFAVRILIPGTKAGDRFIALALVVGTVGATISLGFQGLDALGLQANRLAEPDVWLAGLGTSYGRTVIAALIAFALAGAALVMNGFIAKAGATAAWILAGIALALSGHASTAAPQWLMRPAVFLHAVAIAAWIGALAPLALALSLERPGATQALHRFSRIIPVFVAALAFAGIVLAFLQVERPGALFETAYGRVLLVKLALLVGLFLLAAINRWFLTGSVETSDPAATRRLVRSIAAETLIALLIVGVVATWRFTPPPRALAAAAAAANAPATSHLHTAKAMAVLTVTPGRVGSVSATAVITIGASRPLVAREVTFVFSHPKAGIEPFGRPAEKSGDGRWQANGVILPLAGEWNVRTDVLISDFEMVKLEGRITIQP